MTATPEALAIRVRAKALAASLRSAGYSIQTITFRSGASLVILHALSDSAWDIKREVEAVAAIEAKCDAATPGPKVKYVWAMQHQRPLGDVTTLFSREFRGPIGATLGYVWCKDGKTLRIAATHGVFDVTARVSQTSYSIPVAP